MVEFLSNNRDDFDLIKGLWSRKNGEITKGEPRPLIENLDELPFPAWELIKDLNNYQPPEFGKNIR